MSMSPHECREQALAAQVELLTHRLVEARMVVMVQAQYIVDLERRMADVKTIRDSDSPVRGLL